MERLRIFGLWEMERLHIFGLQEMELLRVFGLQLLREIFSFSPFSPWFWIVMKKQPYTFDQWILLYDIWKNSFWWRNPFKFLNNLILLTLCSYHLQMSIYWILQYHWIHQYFKYFGLSKTSTFKTSTLDTWTVEDYNCFWSFIFLKHFKLFNAKLFVMLKRSSKSRLVCWSDEIFKTFLKL